MARKKVLVSLPEGLLFQIDSVTLRDRMNRSELIGEVMRCYLAERQRADARQRMKEGYLQMAQINKEWAELGLSLDSATFDRYEDFLAEGEA